MQKITQVVSECRVSPEVYEPVVGTVGSGLVGALVGFTGAIINDYLIHRDEPHPGGIEPHDYLQPSIVTGSASVALFFLIYYRNEIGIGLRNCFGSVSRTMTPLLARHSGAPDRPDLQEPLLRQEEGRGQEPSL